MKKGFTLVEVMVTSLILSFVLLGVGAAMTLSNDIYKDTFETYIQRAQLTNAFDLIKNDIRKGARVEVVSGKLSIYNNDNQLFCEYYGNEDGDLFKESKDGKFKLNNGKVTINHSFEFNGNSSAFISLSSNFNGQTSSKGGGSKDIEKITVNCRNHVN